MSKLDLLKEPQSVITKIDMNDPLFEQKLAVAKQEEEAVNTIVAKTSELFGAKVDIMGYNLIQNGPDTKLVLTIGISRKEVKKMITKPEIIANLQADPLWLIPEGATEDEKLWFREAKVELAEAARTPAPEAPASTDAPAPEGNVTGTVTPEAPVEQPVDTTAPAVDPVSPVNTETTPTADAPAE